ncbi:putative GTP binding protein [Talaromyces proteolyticus]|uniref:GTP binding protein n=1 Tax=Talaromyces proteolyticus TaxID=1131652 RepID=A0AAD4KNU4_9EURO|nr:putative GTP binding protein [Talaromyces proteolyticus]KAH8696010.1 putative GTP binding protein [Talaromyces proteolyticus]
MGSGTQHPLSELSPMAQRRNSPSWNQTGKMTLGSSPFESSPFNTSHSPRLFWQGRESVSSYQSLNSENTKPYDPDMSYSPTKRASIENLKRASRVKNSSIIAREMNNEYDPAHLSLPERPLATGRSFHGRSQSDAQYEPSITKEDSQYQLDDIRESPKHTPPSPSKDQPSPPKSSLSKATRFGMKKFDPESDIWSDVEHTPLRFVDRNPKSVTFDAAPPQVNEYEMTTPDLSSIASESREGSYDFYEEEIDVSFDRGSSLDRDDSFDASLEDLEKTPVVLPEDWRFMSPDTANPELVNGSEDPFTDEGSPSPEAQPHANTNLSNRSSRVESLDSNGEKRPLPPLPSAKIQEQSSPATSPSKLSAAFERATSGQRVLPSPPAAASCSKTDITGRGHHSMTLEDRLRLMMLQGNDQGSPQSEADRQRERRMRRAGARERSAGAESDGRQSSEPTASEVATPPPISREDILRNIKNNNDMSYDDANDYSSPFASSPPFDTPYDPDVPIPSLEDRLDDIDVDIKREQSDDEDIYDLPEYYGPQAHGLPLPEGDSGVEGEDDGSNYSRNSKETLKDDRSGSEEPMDDQTTPVPENHPDNGQHAAIHQQDLTTTNAKVSSEFNDFKPNFEIKQESPQRPTTPEGQIGDVLSEPSTPGSVIRHPVEEESEDEEEAPMLEAIPDPVATIKAPGTGLKARPSLTPADSQAMAAARRKVSTQSSIPPSVEEPGFGGLDNEAEEPVAEFSNANDNSPPKLSLPDTLQRQSSLIKLDVPFSSTSESFFGLDKEFDRVIEAQKRGYLMRQNTKVIIASSRNEEEPEPPLPSTTTSTSTEAVDVKPSNSSPSRKISQPTWTAEPWNGKMRRQSVKTTGGIKKKPVPGTVPPLPGMPSNVQDIQHAVEEPESPALVEDGQERGRLFVKVVGVRDLDLPLPRGESHKFSLTLDNGLHCVTTSWLELGKTAPIGQEFELIVQNDLEFQLTLQMKVEGTMLKQSPEPVAPANVPKQKSSAFSRVFASPKKRKEMELKQQMEQQQKQKLDSKGYPGPWDKLRSLIDGDGSFARAYVSLGDHEKYAFGRPYTVQIPCFNEWAIEEPSSLKSKKSSSSNITQKRPPYKVGNLELQLLFVPKPAGAKEDDMPKSMNACIREMREAEATASRMWEGFLSQQGGDCPYWRRRFFRLQGSKLTAYHEVTRQPRATINLAKAAKLIDDKSILTQKETITKGGGRRKSAFSEEEEGYMFVEEGFRIRFANGEVIDFYADSAAEKEGWMEVLCETVGKGYAAGSGHVKAWTELVFRHERGMNAKREALDRLMTSNGAPNPKRGPPPMNDSTKQAPSHPSRPRHQHNFSQPEVRSPDARREKTRSMMF